MQQLIDTLINGPARYTQEHHLSDSMTLVVVLGALFVEFGLAYLFILLIIKFFQYSRTFFSFFLQRIGISKKEVEYIFSHLYTL